MSKNKKDLLLKCQLLLLSMSEKEVIVPLIHMETYMNISNYKDECVEKLFELTNKATPTKPTFEDDEYMKSIMIRNNIDAWCVNCDNGLSVGNNYCGNCGQKIDWSKNEK